ncbi:MAG: hypothetical protein IKZ50_01645 [Bacteroidales bacterium]|nr:hypothetical protein [Bacteroidales bacterium]
MGDIQSYIFSLRYIALAIVICYFVLVLLGKKLQPKALFSRKTVYVIVGLLLVYYVLFSIQRYQVRDSLHTLVSMVDYNKTVDERLANCNRPDSVIYELNQQKSRLELLKGKNSMITKMLGRSGSTDSLINQMDRFLEAQLFRAQNVNCKSFEHFTPSIYLNSADELRSIKPEGLNGAYISAGLTIDEISTFRNNNILLVRIVQTDKDTVLYEQSYVPQSGINAFVLPNFFNSDKVELQLGYVNKQEKNTYHYIVERPYERK